MNYRLTHQQLKVIENQFNVERALPTKESIKQLHVSYSHVFRSPESALAFTRGIMLGKGETVIAGHTRDSVGDLWWLGIRVDDFGQWKNNGGYHHAARRDPETPAEQML
ncbi:MAG: hypothetical protein OEX07_09305 [Gammaproteobacteria bacterium]|nr:hypothetical protein [Gammaproteobacteria bacterium]